MKPGLACARGALIVAAAVGATLMLGAVSASAASRPAAQVRAVYRSVLTHEYYGPASAVCSRLTPAGKRSFTAGGSPSCAAAFRAQQHVLKHKTRGIDDSGYSARAWRKVVNGVMASLKVTVHGSHASAIGRPSGIPGKTTLVKVHGRWMFSSYPPSIQP